MGEPQNILSHISQNIQSLVSQAQLKAELERCKTAGFLRSITENEALFDLFDLLLRQDQISVLCKHIASASRLEPIAEWILRKCKILQSICEELSKPQVDRSHVASNAQHGAAVASALNNISVLMNALYLESSRLRVDDPKVGALQVAFKQLEIDSQYLELWIWLNSHDLLAVTPPIPSHSFLEDPDEPFIKLMFTEASISDDYPPSCPWSLLNAAWAGYSDPTETQVLVSKLKVIFYYLLDISITAQDGNIELNRATIRSFSETFSQILTLPLQSQVKAYWLLDNSEQNYSVLNNAFQYFGFVGRDLSVADAAYLLLSAPGVRIQWPAKVFRRLVADQCTMVEQLCQRDDLALSVSDHELILRLLLPQNLLVSLQFIRKQAKATLEHDSAHLAKMMNVVFDYCWSNKKIESLFLLSFTLDEEALLLQFLQAHNDQSDKRILYFLQRSQFAKAVHTSHESNSSDRYQRLVANYESVLPRSLLRYSKVVEAQAAVSEAAMQVGGSDNSPERFSILKTPRTVRAPARFSQHASFEAPSMGTGAKKKSAPFTPYVVPNTPASRIRSVHGSKSFAPFLLSSSRRSTQRPRQAAPSTPQVIPFSTA